MELLKDVGDVIEAENTEDVSSIAEKKDDSPVSSNSNSNESYPDENAVDEKKKYEIRREETIRETQEREKARYNQLLTLMKKSDLFVKMIFQRMEESKKVAEDRIERLKNSKRKRPAAQTSNQRAKRRRVVKELNDDEVENDDVEENEEGQKEDKEDGEKKLFCGGTLRDYQVDGVKWLTSLYENGISGILADEMGLGKTVQVIATIASMIERGVNGPFLIIVPLSTLTNWTNEFRRFAPSIPVILYHALKEDRQELRDELDKTTRLSNEMKTQPVLVSSYDIIMNDTNLLRHYQWKALVVDEGHRLKNHNCKLMKQLKKLRTEFRLLLTGTPLQNELSELWSLLNFILPEIFNKLNTFEEWFDRGSLREESGRRQILNQEKEKRVLSMMHQILTPFMLRRLKTDVELTIPPKKEIVLHAPLSEYQKCLYDQVLDGTIDSMRRENGVAKNEFTVELLPDKREGSRDVKYDESLDDDIFDSEMDDEEIAAALSRGQSIMPKLHTVEAKPPPKAELHIKLINSVMILRRIVNHTHMVNYPLDNLGEYCLDERLIENSGKIQILSKLLPALKSRGHKALIFSQFTSMLDILQDYFNYVGFKYSRIDGTMKLEERDDQIKWFYEEEEIFIFLISTRAGGLGLNLTAADTVIFFDSDWNPQCDYQAQDRCHRIGQTKPVLIYRLLVPGTVEEKMYETANNKKALGRLVIHGKRFKKSLKSKKQWDDIQFDIGDDELLKLLTFRDEKATIDVDIYDDDYLNKILDRSDLLKEWESQQC